MAMTTGGTENPNVGVSGNAAEVWEQTVKRDSERWMFTSDGVKIVPGLRVWDYDWERSIVAEPQFDRESMDSHDGAHSRYGGKWWDGWFDMRHPGSSTRQSIMNGERMRVYHWSTGEKA